MVVRGSWKVQEGLLEVLEGLLRLAARSETTRYWLVDTRKGLLPPAALLSTGSLRPPALYGNQSLQRKLLGNRKPFPPSKQI